MEIDPAAVKIELLELFERHGLKVAVGLTTRGVAIRSQDQRVDASNASASAFAAAIVDLIKTKRYAEAAQLLDQRAEEEAARRRDRDGTFEVQVLRARFARDKLAQQGQNPTQRDVANFLCAEKHWACATKEVLGAAFSA